MPAIFNDQEYLLIEDCKPGYLYFIQARNFAIAVYDEKKKGFVGLREKFGSEYLATEYHWDTGEPFGTAHPIEELEKAPFEGTEEDDTVIAYLKEKREQYRQKVTDFRWAGRDPAKT